MRVCQHVLRRPTGTGVGRVEFIMIANRILVHDAERGSRGGGLGRWDRHADGIGTELIGEGAFGPLASANTPPTQSTQPVSRTARINSN